MQVVMPESWLLQSRSEKQRQKTLMENRWLTLALLGGGGDAFEKGPGNIVSIICLSLRNSPMPGDFASDEVVMRGLDVSSFTNPADKADALLNVEIQQVAQHMLLKNVGFRISLHQLTSFGLLSEVAESVSGMKTGDVNRFNRFVWELGRITESWAFIQQSIGSTNEGGGREEIILWEGGQGQIKALADFVKGTNHVAQNWRRGQDAWKERRCSHCDGRYLR